MDAILAQLPNPATHEKADILLVSLTLRNPKAGEFFRLDHWRERSLACAYLAWGFNIGNPDPPFFHVTDQGRRSLGDVSRDPSNHDGYLAHLRGAGKLNPVAHSYLQEAVACYSSDLPKAAAVMVGAAAESLVLELRDLIVACLGALGRAVSKRVARLESKDRS